MSATGYVDTCGFIPTAGGTGDFVVAAALTGYQSPASAGAVNATVYSYRAESVDKSQWENGFGAWTAASTTLARTTITASSTGAKVSFSAAPNVFLTALSADLQNAALLNSGTLPVGRLNGGTANQFVQGDGSYQLQGRKLLNTLTASNSAALSDTTSLTAIFKGYEFVLEAITPATNNVTLAFQVQVAGTFQSTSYVSSTNNANGSAVGSSSNTGGIIIGPASLIPNTAPGVWGRFYMGDPTQTSTAKLVYGTHSLMSGTAAYIGSSGGGYTGSASAVTGIQLLTSSGNITSGTFKIYGLS